MATVDVLLPTYNRLTSLIRTLSGVAAQTLRDLHVIVADQSDAPVENEQVVQTLRRVIESRGGSVEWHTRPQIHGITEQRDFLLKRATADAVLYLDDDVLMEPWVIERLLETLRAEGCGFVGAFPAGLSHRGRQPALAPAQVGGRLLDPVQHALRRDAPSPHLAGGRGRRLDADTTRRRLPAGLRRG